MQFDSIYQNLKGDSPEGSIFLNGCWVCFALKLAVSISFCTVLSNSDAFFTFRTWCLSLLGEHFLYMIQDKSQISVWLWSEVNKAKLNCLKYVWDTQINVLVSSMFRGNKVMLCCLTPVLKEHWEHFSLFFFPHPFLLLFVWYFWRWILKSMSSDHLDIVVWSIFCSVLYWWMQSNFIHCKRKLDFCKNKIIFKYVPFMRLKLQGPALSKEIFFS